MRRRQEVDSEVFGSNLRFYRNLREFTVEEVKEYLCLESVQSIYQWETGKNFPQADILFALMELYEVEFRDLIEEKQEKNLDFLLYHLQDAKQVKPVMINFDWSRRVRAIRNLERDRLYIGHHNRIKKV